MSVSSQITLLVPDLFAQRDLVDLKKMPALGRLLARAQRTVDPAVDMETWLCQAFGVERQHDWPIAPLTLTVDGADPQKYYWLRCDPVHLRADRARVVLMDSSSFGPTGSEAQRLVCALNENFAGSGFEFLALRPERWYLRLAEMPDMTTSPLPHVIGKDIDRYLPSGNDGLAWHRTLNEMQMVMHAHDVNLEREAKGAPVLNSVWPWGGGYAPPVTRRPYEAVWSKDALAQALALKSGAQCHPVVDTFGDVGSGNRSAQRMLVVLPHLRSALRSEGIEAWYALLLETERNWFLPALAALREGRIETLELMAPAGDACRRYIVKSGDLWKFWRRSRD